MHPELDAARSGIDAPFLVLRPHVAQQTGEQRAMDRSITLGLRPIGARDPPAHLHRGGVKLRVHLAPLTHAADREKTGTARFRQLAVRFLVIKQLAKMLPKLQIADEVRSLVVESRVRQVGRSAAL